MFGVVTNIDYTKMTGEEVIHWLHERCGKSEEIHAVMKKDLAGGKLPSSDFGSERRVVVDNDHCLKPECDDEELGIRSLYED